MADVSATEVFWVLWFILLSRQPEGNVKSKKSAIRMRAVRYFRSICGKNPLVNRLLFTGYAILMLRKHNYSRQAFLPSDGELLYCALFETHSAHV